MKNIFTILLVVVAGAILNAQTITQSVSQVITAGSTVACRNIETGAASGDNRYFRFFQLSDYNISGSYSITGVQFGIQELNSAVGMYPITVKLYATSAVFPAGFTTLSGYTLIAQQTYNVLNQQNTIFSAPLSAIVPAEQNLVVEVGYEADLSGNTIVFIGSNNLGETAPTYLMTIACGTPQPTPTAQIVNGSQMHMVMNVTGAVAGVTDNSWSKLTIFPNPTNGILHINVEEPVTQIKVFDMLNQIVLHTAGSQSIGTFNLCSGVYRIEVATINGIYTSRFLKE